MTPEDFFFVARLLSRRSGLSLTPNKMAHVERRLASVLRLFDLKDLAGLTRQLRLGHETLADAVTEAMAVGESSFFRDPDLFARIQADVLPAVLAARKRDKRLRIWSAAASTGQEAYSVVMLLAELGLATRGWNIDIIATDLSAAAVAQAEEGRYSEHEMQRGLTAAMRDAYFHNKGREWRINDPLRRMVRFRRFNLLDSFGWLDDLDMVFCRNVLIYFDQPTQQSVLERMADTMAPHGVLLLGNAETVSVMPDFVEAHGGAGIYTRKLPARALLAG